MTWLRSGEGFVNSLKILPGNSYPILLRRLEKFMRSTTVS